MWTVSFNQIPPAVPPLVGKQHVTGVLPIEGHTNPSAPDVAAHKPEHAVCMHGTSVSAIMPAMLQQIELTPDVAGHNPEHAVCVHDRSVSAIMLAMLQQIELIPDVAGHQPEHAVCRHVTTASAIVLAMLQQTQLTPDVAGYKPEYALCGARHKCISHHAGNASYEEAASHPPAPQGGTTGGEVHCSC